LVIGNYLEFGVWNLEFLSTLTLLVSKVSHPCKYHCNVIFICGCDHFIVSN
jgi:hypothetical protein